MKKYSLRNSRIDSIDRLVAPLKIEYAPDDNHQHHPEKFIDIIASNEIEDDCT